MTTPPLGPLQMNSNENHVGIVESGQMAELERWQTKAAQQSGLRGLRARLMANKLESAASDDEIQVIDSDIEYDVEKEHESIDDEFADMLQPRELRKLLLQFQSLVILMLFYQGTIQNYQEDGE